VTGDGVRQEVRISNRATYWPIAPIDLVVGAPILARVLIGRGPLAPLLQAVALGMYAGSALRDWRERRAIQRIDFRREFGADIDHLVPMSREAHVIVVHRLAPRLNDEFTQRRPSRRETATRVDRHLTRYIASITAQRVRTSAEVRGFSLARLAWPSALGVCDILSGDVAIFKDTGLFEPHVIAHEFCHRKGYWKELHAQALAYLALVTSGDPVLRQAARCERVYRSLRVLADRNVAAFRRWVESCHLRPELQRAMLGHRMAGGTGTSGIEIAMRRLYDKRMRLTGQNGVSDYDVGFTSFLNTFEHSSVARQTPPEP
jgi:hypothetical protein